MTRQARANRAAILAVLGLALFASGGCRLIEPPEARISVGYERPLAVGNTTVPFVVQVDRDFFYEAIVPWPEDVVAYEWDFGDGTLRVFGDGELEQGKAGTYRYPHVGKGTHSLRLTVRTRKAQSYVAQIPVRVEPVVWVCDPTSNDVRKMGLDGREITRWPLPLDEPRGLALAEEPDGTWLYVVCANRGSPGIVKLDADTGHLDQGFASRSGFPQAEAARAPGLDPRDLRFADLGSLGRALWHVDAGTHFLYLLSARDAYLLEKYDRERVVSPDGPAIAEDFLRRPLGLDYAVRADRESLWYLEGAPGERGAILYRILIGRRQELIWGVDLRVETNPVRIEDASLFPISGLVAQEEEIWLASQGRNAIVALDPVTGRFVRDVIPSLSGPTSAFDVQR